MALEVKKFKAKTESFASAKQYISICIIILNVACNLFEKYLGYDLHVEHSTANSQSKIGFVPNNTDWVWSYVAGK